MPPKPRQICQYDGRCYRKNPKHFEAFRHPKQCPDHQRGEEEIPSHMGQQLLVETSKDERAPAPAAGAAAAATQGNRRDDTTVEVPLAEVTASPLGTDNAKKESCGFLSPLKRARPERLATPSYGTGLSPKKRLERSDHATCNTSAVDGSCGSESFISTTPTEVARELSTSSSYLGSSAALPTPHRQAQSQPQSQIGTSSPVAVVRRLSASRRKVKSQEGGGSLDGEPTTTDEEEKDPRQGETEVRELQEGMPCLQLLEHLLLHDPIRSCVDDSLDMTSGTGRTLADSESVHLFPDFDGVDSILQGVYSMGFSPADCKMVLRAAVALHPVDPLRAFPGWRLVGPFEVAIRAYHRQKEHQQHQTTQRRGQGVPTCDVSPASFFKTEAAQWRYARYRHDPPECQTVAVDDSGEARHLCYFRDSPSDCPTLLVEGAPERGSIFAIVSCTLAAFLMAEANEGRHHRVRSAFTSVLNRLEAEERCDWCASLELLQKGDSPASLSVQRTSAERQRKRGQLATTFHSLGISIPYDKNTELGYRPLNLTSRRLQAILENWDLDFADRLEAHIVRAQRQHQELRGVNPTILATLNANKARRSVTDVGAARSPRAFTTSDWNDIHEQFRYADMANDEGDFGLNLELGLNIFSLIQAPSLLPESNETAHGQDEKKAIEEQEGAHEKSPNTQDTVDRINPLLWHAFRLLDCVYMLTGRSLYRHLLRCHLPVLAGQQPALLDSNAVFKA